jgi:hypothetical protein
MIERWVMSRHLLAWTQGPEMRKKILMRANEACAENNERPHLSDLSPQGRPVLEGLRGLSNRAPPELSSGAEPRKTRGRAQAPTGLSSASGEPASGSRAGFGRETPLL